jgi:hypothetical protein
LSMVQHSRSGTKAQHNAGHWCLEQMAVKKTMWPHQSTEFTGNCIYEKKSITNLSNFRCWFRAEGCVLKTQMRWNLVQVRLSVPWWSNRLWVISGWEVTYMTGLALSMC